MVLFLLFPRTWKLRCYANYLFGQIIKSCFARKMRKWFKFLSFKVSGCIDVTSCFDKGDFWDFLFAFLCTKPCLKRNLVLKENVCFQGVHIFSSQKGAKSNFDRVVSSYIIRIFQVFLAMKFTSTETGTPRVIIPS